jgi:hypothetical protein
MATREEQIAELYQSKLGRAADAEGLNFWLNSGLSVDEIGQSFDSIISDRQATIDRIYQEQLGRAADESGNQYYLGQLDQGLSEADLLRAVNQSLEGQNFDTQLITSLYRQNLARNPEQEGFQYWLSEAQKLGLSPSEIEAAILDSARQAEQVDRGIVGQTFTDMQLADLEADPYGGRYITNSIYDLLPDAVNVSMIGDRQAQFVSPVTQQPVISQYTTGGSAGFTAGAGLDVLNTPAVQAAIQRALDSGAMTPAEYRTMYADIQAAQNMEDVYAAFNKPQAQVVIDALYGQQIGEANTLAQAQAEAAQRQAVLSAQDPGFYQGNFELADAYRAAGLDFPFGRDAFSGYDTRTDQSNVVTDANFNSQVNNLLRTLYGEFGGEQDMITPLTGQYYSESGLQQGYTPPGSPGTMFRSGVAGYTPNLPTMFQFGAPPVDATFQQYRPGAFQPAGVTTGGFITGYTADGQPIYSEYNNPSVNVPVPSQMNAAQAAYPTSPITAQNFDAAAYLAAYPDVAGNAMYGSNPYQHYLDYGIKEGREAVRIPFNYTQSSQLINPSANLQTIDATSNFFTAPTGQIYASPDAYYASISQSAGG